ncbi:MAG: flavodoxin domain-containing protein [Candidatus Bathyarchaeota archaeon]
MKALVIYDTFFGNTEQVARAISDSLGAESTAIRVADANHGQLDGLGLLVVGSPTRAFRPTKPISQFLDRIPRDTLKGISVAAFDTRMSEAELNSPLLGIIVKLFGYASKPISDKLVRKGGEQAAPPEGFIVEGTEGPLRDGELERAWAWAKQITETR